MIYVGLWRWVFLLALALELPLVFLAAPREHRVRATFASLLGNALTHPALWFLWPRVLPYGLAIVVGEVFAIAVEGAAMATVGKLGRRGFVLALMVNGYSWAVGELVMRGIGPALLRLWLGR